MAVTRLNTKNAAPPGYARDSQSGDMSPLSPLPCPNCGKPSSYNRKLDRYLHNDASDPRSCWAALSRGDQRLAATLRQTANRGTT